MQFWPPDDEHMCSKHVEAWNKTYCKTKILCIKLVNYRDKYTIYLSSTTRLICLFWPSPGIITETKNGQCTGWWAFQIQYNGHQKDTACQWNWATINMEAIHNIWSWFPGRLPADVNFFTVDAYTDFPYCRSNINWLPNYRMHLFSLLHRACCRVTQLLYQLLHIYINL